MPTKPQRDLHQSLKTDIVGRTSVQGVNLVAVKQQWGKDDVGFGLHAEPTSYSTSGIQTTDFLAYLGFERNSCPFVVTHDAYCKRIAESFPIESFAEAFGTSLTAFKQASRHLESCGFAFDQLEGWGYFTGRTSRSRSGLYRSSGDGHTAAVRKAMKTSEDESFQFAFTWIEGERAKGWTTHVRPKNPPLSSELVGVFEFLKLEQFDECPEFGFDECQWRFTPYESHGDSVFDGNAQYAHALFGALAGNFSPGIKNLLEAHRLVEPFGMKLLPFRDAEERREDDIQRHMAARPRAGRPQGARGLPESFDVAVSFAGTERSHAEALAKLVDEAGFSVFYDSFYPAALWGKNLVEWFDEIYRKRSRFCVMFISKEYAERMWTTQERRSAQARALEEKGKEYILPIRVDETELPGMLPTVGHVSLAEDSIVEIAELLEQKLKS